MDTKNTLLDELINILRSAQSVVVLTGAGISAESGIPTFREAQTGLWARYDPMELATPEAFQRNPRLVWEWYTWRRKLVAKAKPNPAHFALVTLESHLPKFTLVTQNIDGLHQQAGSQSVIELHGNIMRNKCTEKGHIVDKWLPTEKIPPTCPHCQGILRPDVVWFGEDLPEDAFRQAKKAIYDCDLLFSIGTSGTVYPANILAKYALKKEVAKLIEINPEKTPSSSYFNFTLSAKAGEILPHIVDLALQ